MFFLPYLRAFSPVHPFVRTAATNLFPILLNNYNTYGLPVTFHIYTTISYSLLANNLPEFYDGVRASSIPHADFPFKAFLLIAITPQTNNIFPAALCSARLQQMARRGLPRQAICIYIATSESVLALL
jgi:hypothetical protein